MPTPSRGHGTHHLLLTESQRLANACVVERIGDELCARKVVVGGVAIGHGDCVGTRQDRRSAPVGAVFENHDLFRLEAELLSGQQIDFRIGLTVMDVLCGENEAEAMLEIKPRQDVVGIFASRACRYRDWHIRRLEVMDERHDAWHRRE